MEQHIECRRGSVYDRNLRRHERLWALHAIMKQ